VNAGLVETGIGFRAANLKRIPDRPYVDAVGHLIDLRRRMPAVTMPFLRMGRVRKGYGAQVEFDGTMTLATHLWEHGETNMYRSRPWDIGPDGLHYTSCPWTPTYLITHEFGHEFSIWIRRGSASPELRRSFSEWYDSERHGPPISSYGLRNEEERLAEVFADAILARRTPIGQSLFRWLVKHKLYQP
jgi:hypothetical protein